MDSHFYYYLFIKIREHLQVTFTALFLASAVAIPLGIFLAKMRREKLAAIVLRIVGALQTVPGLALIALTTALFVLVRPIFPLPTTGFFPGTLVLSIYAVLPMMNSSYGGIKGIPRSLLEVARGMGMTRMQILYLVEFPIAFPEILTGFRTALIWTFSSATLTSLIGSGGLGDLILQGLRSMNVTLIACGTIPLMILAILFDSTISWMGSRLSPVRS
ncbi:MAG: ABC transporter permease [Chlamydiota bacterium]